jgi:hypothetical protein
MAVEYTQNSIHPKRVKQTTGQGTEDLMSQKVVTEELGNRVNKAGDTIKGNLGLEKVNPTYGLHQLGGGQKLEALANPDAPAVVIVGAKGITGVAEVASLQITAGVTADGNVVVTLDGVATNVAVDDGVAEVASLQITAAPTTLGNVTVTLNGVATDIPIDPAIETTAVAVADKIRATAFAGWTTGGAAGTDTVTFTADVKEVKTDATYADGGTGATGTMTTTTQGVNPDTAINVVDKIRATAFAGWTTGGTAGTDTVTFTADETGAKADATYSEGTTGATGTMTTTTQGVTDTRTAYDYFVVAEDRNGFKTAVSASGGVTDGNPALDANNYNAISWAAIEGAVKYHIIKNDTATLLGTTVETSLNDTGQATAAFAAPTRNETADVVIGGLFKSEGGRIRQGSYTNLPLSGAVAWDVQDLIEGKAKVAIPNSWSGTDIAFSLSNVENGFTGILAVYNNDTVLHNISLPTASNYAVSEGESSVISLSAGSITELIFAHDSAKIKVTKGVFVAI